MNIYLIGDYSSDMDEGLKNIAHSFFFCLKDKNNVEILNIKKPFTIYSLKTILDYQPDVIHYFTAPTISSFIILNIFYLRWPKSKTFISALHPNSFIARKSNISKIILRFISKPSAILYQCYPELLKGMSDNLFYLANGVNVSKFKPVAAENKRILRKKYGIKEDKFVILHVGHLSKKRNLEIFNYLQNLNADHQVVIAGSTYIERDRELLDHLQKNCCILFTGYIEKIEELYAISDCYIFAVPWGNTISIPLTILEAMACNLPVIALNYPTLSIFDDVIGLHLVNSIDEIPEKINCIKELQKKEIKSETREAILQYSWEHICKQLMDIYRKSMGDKL